MSNIVPFEQLQAYSLRNLCFTFTAVQFILGGLHDKTQIRDLGGYAIFGGVYFLIAGVLMHRKLSSSSRAGAAVATGRE